VGPVEQASEDFAVLFGVPDFVTQHMRKLMEQHVHEHVFVVVFSVFILHTDVHVLFVDGKRFVAPVQ
jgi:hypothetical protein